MEAAQRNNVVAFLYENPDEGLRIERESQKWRVIGHWKHNLLANRRRMTSKGRTIKAQVKPESGRKLVPPSLEGWLPLESLVRAIRSSPVICQVI